MALLAIDTATSTLALAVGDDDGHVLAAWSSRIPKMHATYVNPLIDEMLATVGFDLRDIKGIIVGMGPGSYTGIRIGVTVAKVLAIARGIAVVGQSSLASAAYALRLQYGLVAVLWDARRHSAYTVAYRVQYGAFVEVLSEEKRDIASFMGLLAHEVQTGEAVYLLGDVAGVAAQEYASAFSCNPVIVYDATASVYAENLLSLGYLELHKKMRSLEVSDHGKEAHVLVPRYLQLAEAEARWLEKRRGSSSNESD